MATFYHDSSRKSIFAERATQFGPISGPETCQVDLLEWSPGIVLSPGRTVSLAIICQSIYAHVPLRK